MQCLNELWRPVIGWTVLYEVSDLGRVRSLDRLTRNRCGQFVKPGRVLKPGPSGGHLTVCLHYQGKGTTRWVHQLVLEAFVGPCPSGMECLHGPGGNLDNCLANLRYGTRAENSADMDRDGARVIISGEAHGSAKLTDEIVVECRRRSKAGEATRALAREFGVANPTMLHAIRGDTWKHLRTVEAT